MPGKGANTEQGFELNNQKQLLVLVRYKPQAAMKADDMLGGAANAVQSVVDKVENAAGSAPGLSLFFKEEKEPEKKSDKEYNYFKEYKDWDTYMNKMKSDFPDKINIDNEVLVFDFDATDVDGRKSEGKKLCNQIKSKTGGWKNYTAFFHFVGLGQGGNVANECINELCKESDFQNKWLVKSVIYVGTPLYKNQHQFDEEKAFRGKGKKYMFGNAFDLTAQVIAYFEPEEGLRKLIAECNSNTLSVFTGKIKPQLVTALSRLLDIEGFGTGRDNEGNINKLKQLKDDIQGLVAECINAIKTLFNAFPDLMKLSDLPQFDKMLNGLDEVPGECVKRFEKFTDELQRSVAGTSVNTDRINKAKILNFLCPLVDRLTGILQLFTIGSATTYKAFDNLIAKAGIKKILAPETAALRIIPVDPYISKVKEMADTAKGKELAAKKEGKPADGKDAAAIIYDQSISMISISKENISRAAQGKDLDLENDKNIGDDIKAKIANAIAALLMPMMPSKEKFYAQLLQYLPLDGMNNFIAKLTGDAAFSPLQNITKGLLGDFDEGTSEEPGLKTSLKNFDIELERVKGFFKKNNYTVHKDANSLYFVYNSHNLMLKKPYGEILHTIDKEIGYLDHMENTGNLNNYTLEKNEYTSKGNGQKENAVPAKAIAE